MRFAVWPVVAVCLGVLVACSLNTEATGAGALPEAGPTGGTSGTGGTGGTGGAAGSGATNNCFPSPGQKFCGGQLCPSKTDPTHGCAQTSCAPCSLPNAIADCAADGTCAVESCNPGFADCDSVSGDGCEVNIESDPHHCGSCGHDCFTPGDATNWACVQGVCQVSQCPVGRGDCNHDPTDKCEVDTQTDVNNCGFCGNVCNIAHAVAKCSAGQCAIDHCQPGWADCDGNPANGCEQDIATDASHCGSCSKVCNTTNGNAVCVGGKCAISCNPNYGNCDGNADNGCETNLQTDPAHCGSCALACSTNHSTPTCNGGQCSAVCTGSWRDCDGLQANGCETNLQTDPGHCGSCGTACSTNHDTPGCSSGQCSIQCSSGYGDCNGNVSDGCETNLQTDPSHCGSCGTACSTNHSTPTCNGGQCNAVCTGSWRDCDGLQANGCEANLQTDPSHCGSCGTACSTNHDTPSCSSGQCSIQCNSGYGDCNGNVSDGCETDLTQTSTCGSCTNDCTTAVQHASGATCSSGSCSYTGTCAANWGDCNGNKSDGCETDLTQDAHCGDCTTVCSSPKTCKLVSGTYQCSP